MQRMVLCVLAVLSMFLIVLLPGANADATCVPGIDPASVCGEARAAATGDCQTSDQNVGAGVLVVAPDGTVARVAAGAFCYSYTDGNGDAANARSIYGDVVIPTQGEFFAAWYASGTSGPDQPCNMYLEHEGDFTTVGCPAGSPPIP